MVTNKTPNFIKHLYQPKNSKQFTNDLDVLSTHYKSVSLNELITINKNNPNNLKPSFHLTFDDGLSNFYHVIAPILLEKKIHATVFLNTDFVDNKELFYRYKASLLIENFEKSNGLIQTKYFQFISDFYKKGGNYAAANKLLIVDIIPFLLNITFQNKELLDELAEKINYSFSEFLKKEKPYLTIKQIKELQQKGFTFGAHSCNHPNYSELELKEQLNQTEKSIKWLQDNLSVDYKVFSFPFHDIGVSKDFFSKIEPNLDLSFGTSGIKKDEISFNLHRLDMEKSKTNTKLFLIKEYIKYLLKIALNRNKVRRN